MTDHEWTWADLRGDQLTMLQEAERTLGVDILLAYQQNSQSEIRRENFSQNGLQVAGLNESQVECLQGLEEKVQAVVIAYQQA